MIGEEILTMKNRKFIKLISSLLILSFLMTAFSVFSFAENAEEGGAQEEINTENLAILYNRTFDEGWDYKNGFTTAVNSNNVFIDHEEDILGNYNYFVRYEVANEKKAETRINFDTIAVNTSTKNEVKATIIEFSIKADDVAKLGNIAWFYTSVIQKPYNLLNIDKNGELVAFSGVKGGDLNLGLLENEWINLAYVFDWTQDDLTCTVKWGYGLGNGYSDKKTLNMTYGDAGDIGLWRVYFGFQKSTERAVKSQEETHGMSYCIDNLRAYQGVTDNIELPADDYGLRVNTLEDKVIEIQKNAQDKTKTQRLLEVLAMKVGVEQALIRNEKVSLVDNSGAEYYNGTYGAPVKNGEDIYVPLALILDYIGFPSYVHPDGMSFDITTGTSTTYFTVGRDSATVDGERVMLKSAPGYLENSKGEKYLVISLEDISVLLPGWLALYDDMGLLIVYEDLTPENLDDNEPLVNRKDDLLTMVNIMKKFIFDASVQSENEASYIENGNLIYNDTKNNTNQFKHPYIIADAATFKNLADKYAIEEGNAGYDATLSSYIKSIIDEADKLYASYASVSGTAYKGIKSGKNPQINRTEDGYDAHGRMTKLVEYAEMLPTLAFAYQMTGNLNYARLAYDWSVALGEWNHWGPGYFMNCAQVTSAYAIAYDWLYNAYKNLGFDTDVLAAAIYNLGVHDGYIASSGRVCEHPRKLGETYSVYNTKGDSSNAVGTAGMVIGSLAILDYASGENAPVDALYEIKYLIGNNIQSLIKYGLDVYAPDGSYVESPLHWEAATSGFFRMVMALNSAAGTDYGFMNTWGLEKTCYYAIQIESSDGFIWNYHDGGLDGVGEGESLPSLNTDMFNFVGLYLGDANLISVRQQQIQNGKAVTVYDLLFYPFGAVLEEPELSLDYYMEAAEGYVSRSDWSNGALYTGIMGGMNNVPHGQIDSGNFIYHNKGIAWIIDLGEDNPAMSNYEKTPAKYKYYRVTGEGNNVIIMSDSEIMSYGQYSDGGGVITKTFVNEHGSYALLNNMAAYASYTSYATRGVLVTHDRSTVVLQDELTFVKIQAAAWVLHTAANVELSADGRTAYLTQENAAGELLTLRASIVSPRSDFVFLEQNLASTKISENTVTGDPLEYDRTGISRLVIKSDATLSLDIAVVFEIIDPTKEEPPVPYEWTLMNDWEPSELKIDSEGADANTKRGTPVKTDIRNQTVNAETILKRNTAFTERLSELYRAITNVEYTLKKFTPDSLDINLSESYEDYLDCLDEYEAFIEYVNGSVDAVSSLGFALNGIEIAEDDVTEE
jgi:hypothetical protein